MNSNKFKKTITYIKQNPWTCIFTFILLIQFLLIAVCNIKLIDNNIDCDNAKLFLHTIKMWEHGTLLIPDWSYTTTLELDCSSLLALPLYGLTKNIYLSYGLANIILLATFISLIFWLFKGKDTIYPILAANLVCIPYSMGMLDYFNMMFFAGSQYIIKVALPLLLISIILWMERKRTQKKRIYEYIPIFLLELLIFMCSLSSGVYILFVGLLPLFIAYILYKVYQCENIPFLFYIISGLSIILSIIGIILNNIHMGGARGTGMMLISIYQITANINSCLPGIYELFGGIAPAMDIPVMSPEGINIILKALLVHVFLICGMIAITRIFKKKFDLRTLLLVSVFIWNMFVLLSTNTRAGSATYEYRYHLIGMLPLIFVAVQILVDTWLSLKPFHKNFVAAITVCFVVSINVLSFPTALDPTDEQAELKLLCSYCDEFDWDYVYLYDASNDADMCRLFAESDTEYICVTPQGVTWAYDYYEKYVSGTFSPENAIFVLDSSYNLGDSFELFGYKFVKFDTVANRTLYYFSK